MQKYNKPERKLRLVKRKEPTMEINQEMKKELDTVGKQFVEATTGLLLSYSNRVLEIMIKNSKSKIDDLLLPLLPKINEALLNELKENINNENNTKGDTDIK